MEVPKTHSLLFLWITQCALLYLMNFSFLLVLAPPISGHQGIDIIIYWPWKLKWAHRICRDMACATVLIRISRPALEIYFSFHPITLLAIFSWSSLNVPTFDFPFGIGRPKYFSHSNMTRAPRSCWIAQNNILSSTNKRWEIHTPCRLDKTPLSDRVDPWPDPIFLQVNPTQPG